MESIELLVAHDAARFAKEVRAAEAAMEVSEQEEELADDEAPAVDAPSSSSESGSEDDKHDEL
jgi:hypothetical protein